MYYKLGLSLLQNGAALSLQCGVRIFEVYYKTGKALLQNGAKVVTKRGSFFVLHIGARVVTKRGSFWFRGVSQTF